MCGGFVTGRDEVELRERVEEHVVGNTCPASPDDLTYEEYVQAYFGRGLEP